MLLSHPQKHCVSTLAKICCDEEADIYVAQPPTEGEFQYIPFSRKWVELPVSTIHSFFLFRLALHSLFHSVMRHATLKSNDIYFRQVLVLMQDLPS
jgi:hypothetical protein